VSNRWFIIVISHDGKELPTVLKSISLLKRHPAGAVVTVDGVLAGIESLVESFHRESGIATRLVQRKSGEIGRRAQTRNNGVRALRPCLQCSDWIVFLDGDVAVRPSYLDSFARHAGADVILSYVWRLSPARSDELRRRLATGRTDFAPRLREWAHLAQHALKLETQLRLRNWFGPRRAWWPSLASGNFGVRFGLFDQVNGFDEDLVGWGVEDADLGRRLYAPGAQVECAVLSAAGFHLWHPPAPPLIGRIAAGANGVGLLQEARPATAEWGLKNPKQQAADEPRVTSWGTVE
jgi:hypothetical protein